jgi:hypothetical protein
MKKDIFLLVFILAVVSKSFGQNNPIENLIWSQSYENMHNYFQLSWEVPAQPHNELLGRNNELYRFQTETSLYNLYTLVYGFVYNCGSDFLLYDNQQQAYTDGFDIHVTAVYNQEPAESNYLQTVHSFGAALTSTNFTQEKAILFLNPTSGELTIGNLNLEKIIIYDILGKEIKVFAPTTQIDLSHVSKGFYIIKQFSESKIITDKIVVK